MCTNKGRTITAEGAHLSFVKNSLLGSLSLFMKRINEAIVWIPLEVGHLINFENYFNECGSMDLNL